MNSKELREYLRSTRDQKFRKKSQKQIDAHSRQSALVKEHWQTQDEETRKRRLTRTYSEQTRKVMAKPFTENNPSKDPEKVAKRKQTKLANGSEKPPEYWQMIYDLFWGKDRNSKKLKDKVCKEYGVKPGTLNTLINGGMGMNLPQETKVAHEQRLRNWHEHWGDYRFVYTINGNQFDSLANAGKWFVKENNLPEPIAKDGKVNYGNVVWGYFKMCEKTPTLKKGKYVGWTFIKEERHKEKNYE